MYLCSAVSGMRLSGSRSAARGMPPHSTPNGVPADQKNCYAESYLGRVKHRVLLQLLIATGGYAVAFCRVDDATAAGTLCLAGQSEDPKQGTNRRNTQ